MKGKIKECTLKPVFSINYGTSTKFVQNISMGLLLALPERLHVLHRNIAEYLKIFLTDMMRHHQA